MTIDVLAFATSPRRHGNSETLLDWVLDAMKGEGAAVEKIVVPEADIRPCRGCNICERLNRCVQRDYMDYVHDRIIAADCIVLASPIYCMGLAAQAKVLVDRTQVFRSRKYVLGLPVVPPERKGKRAGIFLSTAGQNWENVFDAAIPSVKCFFNVIDVKNKDTRYLMVNGVDEKGAIARHPTAMRDAQALGREVVAHLREVLAA
ncbi:flavodoxin family protein [Methanoculleus sp. 7T]|uniref:flavodoxin family protein n=1 Tax=Methanoculleus sp. 7T TaxID=2937282 RepID=UPI0020BFB5FF|nr:flavodoxin family protein [Methanoculleus sp. 7T]MCK8518402.1 flavodoxin family protein [Methanoculleus sp. 7T]